MAPEHIQLGSGRFHGQINRFNLGSSILTVADYEGPLRIANGAFSRNGLTFLVSLSDSPKNVLNGFEFTREKLVVFPGGCDHHFRMRGELWCVGIEVALAEINRFAEALHRQEIAPFGQHCVALSVHPRSLSSLRRAVSEVLATSHTNLVWFKKEHNRKRLLEGLIIDLLGSLLSVSSGDRIGMERRRINSKKVFKIAEEYIRSHSSSDISILDLCIATNSSKSSLFEAFQDNIGVSPYQFLRRTRLTKAWKLLRSLSKDSTTVASIAMDCGYGHLGRFSAHFKQIFGEYPSETLRRNH
jgi:AraC-like DNA-binding protein